MASTYSDLKIELIGTGEQTGTWGTTTNNNFSVAFQEAITGSVDVPFSSADVTLTLTDTNAAQTARNLRLNLTGTSGGARQLILGSGCQIEKLYIVNNGLADAVTVKNTTGTGIAVPAGKTMFVFNNGANVVDVTTHLSSLTLGSALPITSGGTGTTSTTFVNLATNVTGDLPFSNLAQGSALSVLGVTGNATADNASIAAGTDNQVLRRSGTSVGFGAVNVASSDAVTGILGSANGGTNNGFFAVSGPTTSTKTMTFPDASTTIVGTTTTQTLTNKTFTGYTETVFAISDGGSVDLDPANGTIQTWTLGASRSPTATNFAAGQSMTLMVDDGTAYTITWPSVTWVGGSAPTLATSGYTVIVLWKVSTTLYGALVGTA